MSKSNINRLAISLYRFMSNRVDETDMIADAEIERLLYRPDPAISPKEYIDNAFSHVQRDVKNDPAAEYEFGSLEKVWRMRRVLMDNAEDIMARYSNLKLWSPLLSFVMLEFGRPVHYADIEQEYNYVLAAAIWILDELYMHGRIYEVHKYLPKMSSDITNEWVPYDFYHPCYSTDLLNSVAQVIGDENYTKQFKGIIGLLDPERVQQAVDNFHTLQSKVIDSYMKTEEYLDRQIIRLADELTMSNKKSVLSISDNEKKRLELAVELKKHRDFQAMFRNDYWMYFGSRQQKVMKRRKIAEYMEIEIENPYEICFSLAYLKSIDDPSTWFEKTGCAVINAAYRLLPWYGCIDNYENEDIYEGSAYDSGGWLDQEQPQEPREVYRKFDKSGLNTAQKIYRLSKGIVPSGKHPYEKERKKMTEDGEDDADYAAEWAEMLFLSKTRHDAVNFLMEDLFDDDESEDDVAQKPVKGCVRKQNDEKNEDIETEELRRKLADVQKQNKSLRAAISETRKIHEAELGASEKELKTLRMAHRELADLRELVFSQEHEQQDTCVLSEPDIQFPYTPNQKTVMFGGHESFLKEFRKRLPCVTCVSSKIYSFDPNLVRYADVVWIQTNSISHPQYWKVIKTAKAYGVQIRYFTYSSAEKCAVQLAEEDKRHNL